MPIHDQGYRRYAGERAPRGQAWTVIARSGIRSMLGRKAFLALLLLAWFPFFVRAVQIYASANLPQAAFLAPTASTFRQFLAQQNIFVFFVAVYVGAGLIANDRRANALQIYLSKPLTRAEYVFGKLAILVAFLLLVTWLPAIVLLLVQIAFAGNFSFFAANAYLFPAITVYSAVETLLGALSMLALSSLSNSSRYVGIMYAVLIFFSQAIFIVVKLSTGSVWWSWLSLVDDVQHVGDAIFRLPHDTGESLAMAAIAIAAVLVGSALILERRVRGVEVVA